MKNSVVMKGNFFAWHLNKRWLQKWKQMHNKRTKGGVSVAKLKCPQKENEKNEHHWWTCIQNWPIGRIKTSTHIKFEGQAVY